MAMKHNIIGFIGAGNMARSLAGGLLGNGWGKDRILLSDPDPATRNTISDILGLKVRERNEDVSAVADVLVLAIKPQLLKAVAETLAATVQTKKPLVISIAAGIRADDIQRWLGGGLAVVRTMPNTAALVSSGATGLYANKLVSAAQRDEAEAILRAVGVTVWLEEESLLDVVTAISGSGPAYFFLVIEALEQAAIRHGLDHGTARLLAIETAYGAAKMALEGGEEPATLRARVTSPGGTTEQAIRVLQQGNITQLFDNAVGAAISRAKELADMLGGK
jgi:pyrroline-5-carboxylate reductase